MVGSRINCQNNDYLKKGHEMLNVLLSCSQAHALSNDTK